MLRIFNTTSLYFSDDLFFTLGLGLDMFSGFPVGFNYQPIDNDVKALKTFLVFSP